MQLCINLLVLGFALIAAQEFLRRAGTRIAFVFFLALPPAVTFLAGAEATAVMRETNSPIVFAWIKFYAMCFSALWATSLRTTSLRTRPWAAPTTALLLLGNIFVAVIQDGCRGGWASYLNAASAALLIAIMPPGVAEIGNGAYSELRQVDRLEVRSWICAYSVWNWVFIFLNCPVVAGQHLAVIGFALAVGIYQPERWLIVRVYTLTLWLILTIAFTAELVEPMDTRSWSDPIAELFAASVSLLCVTAAAIAAGRRYYFLGLLQRSQVNSPRGVRRRMFGAFEP